MTIHRIEYYYYVRVAELGSIELRNCVFSLITIELPSFELKSELRSMELDSELPSTELKSDMKSLIYIIN